jgi:TPM domain
MYWSIESGPNPRRETGGWVSDGADILSLSTEAALNARIDRLEADTSAEVAVVTLEGYNTTFSGSDAGLSNDSGGSSDFGGGFSDGGGGGSDW